MYDELIKNLRKMQSHEYCVLVSIDGFPAMQIVKQAADAIEKLQKRKHGKWVRKEIRGDIRTVCSNCREETGTMYEFNFCPNCGADMRGDSDV